MTSLSPLSKTESTTTTTSTNNNGSSNRSNGNNLSCNIPTRCIEIFLSYRMFDIQIEGLYIIWNLMSSEGVYVVDTLHRFPEIIREIIGLLNHRDTEVTHVVVCIIHQCFSLDFDF